MSKRKSRKETKEKRKLEEHNLNKQKNKLLEQWKEQWNKEEWDEHLDTFFRLFPVVYQYTYYTKEDNKKNNFFYKKVFIKVLGLGFVLYIILFILNLRTENNGLKVFLENGLLTVALVFLSGIISKWLDIKKYQETWSRHSWDVHMMEAEMLKFISYIEPYDNVNRKRIFVERIIKIWDENQNKFVNNMENKEKELMDIFSELK